MNRTASSRLVLRVLLALLLGVGTTAAGSGSPADGETLQEALRRAADETDPSFRLEVLCPLRDSVRGVELLPSGVAIWNHRTQLRVPPPVRKALLGELADRGFAGLEPRYGGRGDAEPQKGAALRITCRVVLELDHLKKSSLQLAEGEQSSELADLANALLDRFEPLVAAGITASGLDDGLAKLAGGELAPELLRLRWVRLPAPSAEGSGTILRVSESVLSRQPYAPGREIGEPEQRPLAAEQVRAVAAAARQAGFPELPVNLWSDESVELEIGVLGHGKTVLARPFQRLDRKQTAGAQGRLDRLLADLRELLTRPEAMPSGD